MRNSSLSLKRRQYQKDIITLLNIEEAIARVQELIDNIFIDTNPIVLYWNDQAGAFIPVNPKDRTPEIKFRIFDDFILWLGEQERIFNHHDFALERRFPKIREAALQFFKATQAEILVPFNLNRSVLAILYLKKRGNSDPYTKKELRFLLEIRDITIVSLSNAALYERLHAMLYHLEEKVKERTSELSNAQAQLIQQEKMASLGVMVAGIAHEINTPTSVVSGAAENISVNLRHILDEIVAHKIPIESIRHLIEEGLRSRTLKTTVTHTAIEKMRLKRGLVPQLLTEKRIELAEAEIRADFLLDFGLSDDAPILKICAMSGIAEFNIFRAIVNIDKNFRNMHFALTAILNIVKALKHYSHRDQAEAENTDVREGLENTLTVFHNQLKHGIQVNRHYEDVSMITCNPGELNQIYSNLLVNSVQAMKGEGSIDISVRERSIEGALDIKQVYDDAKLESMLGSDSANRYVLISLQDSGPGIPKENQIKIFDPFFTTKAPGEGTGLGLGIIRNIVMKHNGILGFSSVPGCTRFTIALPVTPP